MRPKGSSKKLLSYAFSEVSSNIHWSGVGTGENYYLSEIINLSNIHLSRFNCTVVTCTRVHVQSVHTVPDFFC